jgi:hypothetical protein
MEGLSGGIVVAIVDFLMVFIVLGGLAGMLVALRKFIQVWGQLPQKTTPSEIPGESSAPGLDTSQEQQARVCIAAITAAIQEFTALPEGAFHIDYIQPLVEMSSVMTSSQIAAIIAATQQFTGLPLGAFQIEYIEPVSSVAQQSHIIAIAAAMHEYLSAPPGTFRIIKRPPLGMANTWKMAGRLELMEIESE